MVLMTAQKSMLTLNVDYIMVTDSGNDVDFTKT